MLVKTELQKLQMKLIIVSNMSLRQVEQAYTSEVF